jgi:hypothetical protein
MISTYLEPHTKGFKHTSWEPNYIDHSFNTMLIISLVLIYNVTQDHNELGSHLPSLEII